MRDLNFAAETNIAKQNCGRRRPGDQAEIDSGIRITWADEQVCHYSAAAATRLSVLSASTVDRTAHLVTRDRPDELAMRPSIVGANFRWAMR